jgi:hypothetical protein
MTRRAFVAGGIAIGAAVVWTSPFPFAEAAIGQLLPVDDALGATGPTGPTGAAPPEPTATAPGASEARIHLPARIRVGRRGRIGVGIESFGDAVLVGSCRLQAVVQTKMGTRRFLIGDADFRIAPGHEKRVLIDLTGKALNMLQELGALTARLTVKADGNATQRRHVRLVSPRR